MKTLSGIPSGVTPLKYRKSSGLNTVPSRSIGSPMYCAHQDAMSLFRSNEARRLRYSSVENPTP